MRALRTSRRRFALRAALLAWLALAVPTTLPAAGIELAPPPNDNFAAAVAIGGPGALTGTTVEATGEAGEPVHNGTITSAWYSFTPSVSKDVNVNTCTGTAYDSHIAVYTGSSVSALTPVAVNDDSCALQSSVTFSAEAGTTYRIAVDGAGADAGRFTLTVVAGAPANDDFASATAITSDGDLSGSNVGATGETGEPDHGGTSTPVSSVWFTFTPATTVMVTFSTCALANFDTVIAVYRGSSVDALSLITANDDACGSASEAAFDATGGTEYHIAIDGFGDATGTFTLSASGLGAPPPVPPANDNWAGALDVSLGGTVSGTNAGATGETGEPAHAGDPGPRNSVWYKLTLGADANVTVETCGSGLDTALAAYRGSGVGALTEVASNDEACGLQSSLTFPGTAGTLYTFAVDGYGDNTGLFSLTVTIGPPPNDDWVNAQDITPGLAVAGGSNVGATGEPGEPDHGGASLPLKSVWYTFTLSTTKVVHIDTCGSSLDTVLAAYTGSSVSTLTPVTSNNNACGTQSRIVFPANAGVMYTVALDGAGSAAGPFTLNYAERTRPVHPRPSSGPGPQ